MTREEALEYVNNMYMYEDTKNALETLIPEFGKAGSDMIMDYEKKYKEALEMVRRLHDRMQVLSSTDALVASSELEFIFPELAESDDERIRKAIVGLIEELQRSDKYFAGVKLTDMLAYLEKQKGPENTSASTMAPSCWEVEQKEQKPNIELIQRSWYMEGYHDREFGKEPKWIIKTGEGGPKHELNPRYGQPLTERQVTEEQLHNLNEAIKSFRMDGFDRIADSLHSLYNILTTQAQKSAEWSEDDEKKLERVDDLLWMLDDYLGNDCSICEEKTARLRDEIHNELFPWLEFLRPQYHGDVTMTEAYKMGKEAGEASRWKPSEEQMNKLKEVIYGLCTCGNGPVLKSLYEDLKKLI